MFNKKDKKEVPNRQTRRAEAKRHTNPKYKMGLAIDRIKKNEQDKVSRKLKDEKIEKIKARRMLRDDIRKMIAKKEGVNWRRIVLTSKIEEGAETLYTIKKHA